MNAATSLRGTVGIKTCSYPWLKQSNIFSISVQCTLQVPALEPLSGKDVLVKAC